MVGGRKRRPAGPPPACTHPRAASRGTAEAHSALLLLILASKSLEHEKPKAGSVLEKAELARTACTLLLFHVTHSLSTHWVSGAQRVIAHLEENLRKRGLEANTMVLLGCAFPWGPPVDACKWDPPPDVACSQKDCIMPLHQCAFCPLSAALQSNPQPQICRGPLK